MGLDYAKLCKRCLGEIEPTKSMARHLARCKLPYTANIGESDSLVVYKLDPTVPMRQRRFAMLSVAEAMQTSKEIAASDRGWYAHIDKEDYEFIKTHAYVFVDGGLTAGFVVLVWMSKHWCISRVWVALPFRERGIAKRGIGLIAQHLGTTADELAWLQPLTRNGARLATAVSGESFLVHRGLG